MHRLTCRQDDRVGTGDELLQGPCKALSSGVISPPSSQKRAVAAAPFVSFSRQGHLPEECYVSF